MNPEQKLVISGNHAAAYAAKSVQTQVVAAYPITPQSPVVEKISYFVESGEMPNTRFITVESEQSAIAAVISASATGSRVFTATSANGLAYMFEQLNWAAGNRLPIVMCVATRALGAPWSVWSDNQDAFSVRDSGFLQIYAEDNQEIYDSVIMAYRIAEDSRVYLPILVNYDGFILSHTLMPVTIESDEKIKSFLPNYKPHLKLTDFEHPQGVSPVTTPNPIKREGEKTSPGYFEFRFAMQKAAEYSLDVISEAHKEFAHVFGRSYGNGIIKEYKASDAEILLFAVGSLASESRNSVDELREKGIKAGLISLKVFRPFPIKVLRKAFENAKMIIVFDRNIGYGYEGILAYELKAALYGSENSPWIKGYIAGLGGRDVTTSMLTEGVLKAIHEKEDLGITQKDILGTKYIGLKLEEINEQWQLN